MENTPAVTVGAPDDRGLRKVLINGKPAGKVRSPGDLQRLLRRSGVSFGHDVHWLGGDSTVWPDRSWQRRTIGALTAAGLLTTAGVLSTIGLADTLNALTYAGRIAGFTFLLTALLEVIAAAATLDYWRKRRIAYSGPVVLLGVSIAFLASFSLFLVQISGRVYNGYLSIWTALTIWSAWALCILVRGNAWKGIHNPKRIAIGAVIPVLLALANLTYSQVYVPYVTTPLVESGAEFRTPSLHRGRTTMYLPVHLYVKNSGKVPVYILGSIYWIRGLPEGQPRDQYKLIDSREFVTPGRALDPGEEIAQDAVIEIHHPDKSNFETISAQTEIYVIRKDRMTMAANYELSRKDVAGLKQEGKDKDPQGPSGDYFRYQSEISNSNEILNVTRGLQRVTLWWVRHPTAPYMYVDVAPPGESKPFDPNKPDANKAEIDRYGLARMRGSMTQTPFAELLEKAQAPQ